MRDTVRSSFKGAFLKDKFAHHGDRFELVVVEDLARMGHLMGQFSRFACLIIEDDEELQHHWHERDIEHT